MQDFDRNIAALLEALKFSPDNIPLKKHIAELLLQAGRTDEAIQHLIESSYGYSISHTGDNRDGAAHSALCLYVAGDTNL